MDAIASLHLGAQPILRVGIPFVETFSQYRNRPFTRRLQYELAQMVDLGPRRLARGLAHHPIRPLRAGPRQPAGNRRTSLGDTTATHDLAQRACYDCHSYETVWPWYTYVAPISWLTQHDVNEGRGRLNFSNWGPGADDSAEITEVVREGEMPPVYYTWMHPSARLSDAERDQLIQGIEITLAAG